jgi:ABC-type histidine transport system ATPase subunit
MNARSESAAVLALSDIHQAYGSHPVLRGLSFELKRGSIGWLP